MAVIRKLFLIIKKILSIINNELHQIKNTLKIKQIQINTYNEHSISISDSFVFRTDKKFETVFGLSIF